MRLWIDDVKPTLRDIFGANVRENRDSVALDTYNDPTDEECESISEESTTISPTSPVEANDEICFLRELLTRVYEQLLLLGYDSGFTNDEIYKLTNDIKEYLEEN